MASAEHTDLELYRAFRRAVRATIASELEAEAAAAAERRDRVRAALPGALARARNRGLCARAWLFGSYAWGDPRERSDVDILAEACADPEALASVVARATGTDVHVVPIEAAPATLRERVLAEGERV